LIDPGKTQFHSLFPFISRVDTISSGIAILKSWFGGENGLIKIPIFLVFLGFIF
jgi:hypothetical protein